MLMCMETLGFFFFFVLEYYVEYLVIIIYCSVALIICLLYSVVRISFLVLITCFIFSAMCLEKRVFYRLISGLHTSINIHLCDQYLFPGEVRNFKPSSSVDQSVVVDLNNPFCDLMPLPQGKSVILDLQFP